MKSILSWILIMLSITSLIGHAGHKAYFTIDQTSDKILLKVRIDETDIREELSKHEFEIGKLELSIGKYLNERMKIYFDDELMIPEFESSYTNGGMIHIKYTFNTKTKTLKSIRVKSTCFKDFDHLYKNVIRLNLLNEDVTYQLSDKRIEFTHKTK